MEWCFCRSEGRAEFCHLGEISILLEVAAWFGMKQGTALCWGGVITVLKRHCASEFPGAGAGVGTVTGDRQAQSFQVISDNSR